MGLNRLQMTAWMAMAGAVSALVYIVFRTVLHHLPGQEESKAEEIDAEEESNVERDMYADNESNSEEDINVEEDIEDQGDVDAEEELYAEEGVDTEDEKNGTRQNGTDSDSGKLGTLSR